MRICRTAAAPASAASAAAEVMISETHDIVVRDEEGAWQFAARKLSVVFEGRLSAGELTRHETGDLSSAGRLVLGILTEDGLIDVERADASLPPRCASLLERAPRRRSPPAPRDTIGTQVDMRDTVLAAPIGEPRSSWPGLQLSFARR